ncbi:hypothetical protein [Phaeobacter gallaeciensis]|uniref:hypothetical protein n=1 Tax=Phaeobacter gallaeciensis TaxID=60890 RepID=UPI00237F1D63|nr:hypothetical protein [Phaeobacter gallaeciensis]MDE4099381.1 hypothetical protein [Phaeobacter gallaeciensis]MDE4108208.1 hypothetical protein [Phaeobacter gallaeciensis]MDE4112640.1 hypothetical protein [Phaeobacter gallaeciensis]MDE4117115.1 hypothetical protein [Phaeobacter gallaeciensis]MDE4121554.1 hypothetical protein [Phaeobacter gallaeciensis]
MKKIILHCGMPKTGSSALQVQLAQSRDTLVEHGYDYLPMGDFKEARQGRITSGNGAGLARAYLNPEHPASLASRRGELTQKFKDAITASDHHVILSSEFFSAAPRLLLGKLVAELSDLGEMHLVFFVREQLNALASNYIQQVKRHLLCQFPDEFFGKWDGYKIPMMYHSYFTQLTGHAPEARISAKPYELSRQHPAGLMGLFLEMIGTSVPTDALPSDTSINLSPSPQEIRLMIEINKHRPRMQFSDMLVESSHMAGRAQIHSHHAILPPAFVREVSAFFQAENEAFFRDFAHSENIYWNAWNEEDFIDLRQVTFDATSVIDILSGLLVRLDQRLAKLENASRAL